MIGKMNERIKFQREVTAPDGIGGITKVWSTFATVWARIETHKGKEDMTEGRMAASELVRFTVYTRADVSEVAQILWRGIAYNVRSVPSGSPRELTMTILAERGVAA